MTDYLDEEVYKVVAITPNPDFRSFYDVNDKNPPPVDHPNTYKPSVYGEIGYMEKSAAEASRDAGDVLIVIEYTPYQLEQLLIVPPFDGYTFDGTVIDTNIWEVYTQDIGCTISQDDAMLHTGTPAGQAHSGGGIIERVVRQTGDGKLTIECDVMMVNSKYTNIEPPVIGASATNTLFDDVYYAMPFNGLFLGIGPRNGTGYNAVQFYTGGGGLNLVDLGNPVASPVVPDVTYHFVIEFDFDLLQATVSIDGGPILLTETIPAYVITQFAAAGYRFTTHISLYDNNMQMVLDNLSLAHAE